MNQFLKFLAYIPWSLLIVINVILLTIIFILNLVGKPTVWVCNNLKKVGDKLGDKIHEDKLDKMLSVINQAKQKGGIYR